jgi:carbon storage regulator
MLYLVRKLNESIIVNNDIEIKIVDLNRKTVKLGITFPKTATVLRKEIYDRITQENLSALKMLEEDDQATDSPPTTSPAEKQPDDNR